ncbi:DNA polymerase III subunit chi [Ventosimonas gracilis]|uniref:DNA polymerase III subunit chi n=1 Tax=Ventosimonas gracilis TaxID=1680762 RepID=A0A139SP88_9GAMM|nr:DNA polymerase III subunit chi [Ventosimonas gracilis]KXU36398.1 DNA polymerase III subunit chi [Ventosimonas gracilis]
MRIEFYRLGSTQADARLRAACQLARKGWQAGLPVFIRCQDGEEMQTIDELLWRFKAEAFVPHELAEDNPVAPVVIGENEPPAQSGGLLINLNRGVSPHIQYFSRIIELVSQDPERLQASRDNFRHYRQQGYQPKALDI